MKHRNIVLHVSLLLTLLIFVFSVELVSAQGPVPSDDDVNAIAQELYCPICENTPLDVCPTEACRDWRELIRQMLAEGRAPEEIKQYFVDHYGARVLSEPPLAGVGWMVYVVPVLAFSAGVFLLARGIKKWVRLPEKGGKEAAGMPGSESGADYRSRLENELQKRD